MKKACTIIFLASLCLFLALTCCACTVNPSSVVNEIITIVSGIIPIASGLASVLLPGEAALITEATTLATNGLAALQNVVKEYEANPNDTALAKVQDAFTTVHDNLSQLLAAAQVKDAKTTAKITAIVNGATATLAMLESQVLANHPKTVAAAQASS